MKKISLSLLIILIAFISSLSLSAPLIAHAQSFTVRTPNFSLYSDMPEVITHGEVNYDTTHFSLYEGTVTEHWCIIFRLPRGKHLTSPFPLFLQPSTSPLLR